MACRCPRVIAYSAPTVPGSSTLIPVISPPGPGSVCVVSTQYTGRPSSAASRAWYAAASR